MQITGQQFSQALLIGAFFFIPIQAAPVNLLLFLAILFWLFSSEKPIEQLKQSWHHPLTKAFIFFALTAWISLFWTENLDTGLELAAKYIIYLLFPIILLMIRSEFTKYYLGAFFAGVALSELLSYAMWFGITDMGKAANDPNLWDHTAFIGHVLYSPIIAFAAYIMLSRLVLFWENHAPWQRALLLFFSLTITINLFFTHGRTGMVALIAMIFVLLIQKFPKAKFKATLISILVSSSILFGAYFSLKDFKQRVDAGYSDIIQLVEDKNAATSIGNRIINWSYSLKIIQENPALGVGIGDYKNEFNKLSSESDYTISTASINPHNQYLFTWATSGSLGLLSLLIVFGMLIFSTIKVNRTQSKHQLNPIRWGIITLFLTICLAENYLWRSNTALLFVIFSALLYKELTTQKVT